jgi:hypothetical protein
MPWRPGPLSGDPGEIHDELYTHDGRCVAVLECFATNPTILLLQSDHAFR